MPTLLIHGRPAAEDAIRASAARKADDELLAWGCAALDVFESFARYVRLKRSWTLKRQWCEAHPDDPRLPERQKQTNDAWRACLAPGGAYDVCERVLMALDRVRLNLDETAVAQLVDRYGTDMATPEHADAVNLFIANELSDFNDFFDAWAISIGGHAKQREEFEPCPF